MIAVGLANTAVFGLSSKLRELNLAGSYIQSLPTTMKHLTRLKHLYVGHLELCTLPELPPSIERLDASGRKSLKSVLFPSMLAEQLKENKKTVAFWNYLNLNKHSLKAISLNAQINIMKFAYQHLFALGTDYGNEDPEYDEDYFYDKGTDVYFHPIKNISKATYVYPRSRVPKWLVYRTTHDYITIETSSVAHLTQFGFIFCLVIPKVSSHGLRLKFSISSGEGKGDSIDMYLARPLGKIESDHVCLMYDHRCSGYLNSRAKIQPRFNISVTAVSVILKSKYVPVMLKGNGVSPINTSEYQNFVHHMVLANSTISLNERN